MAYLTRGERFKDARVVYNQNGKQTMVQVSAATKVSQSTISDLENDGSARRVNYEDVACLAKHYGVSADYLLGLTDDHHINPNAVDVLGLPENAVEQLKGVKELADKEIEEGCGEYFQKRLELLRTLLSDKLFKKFLNYFANIYWAAEKTRTEKKKKEAGEGHEERALLDYKVGKYLCLEEFGKLIVSVCQTEDLED